MPRVKKFKFSFSDEPTNENPTGRVNEGGGCEILIVLFIHFQERLSQLKEQLVEDSVAQVTVNEGLMQEFLDIFEETSAEDQVCISPCSVNSVDLPSDYFFVRSSRSMATI